MHSVAHPNSRTFKDLLCFQGLLKDSMNPVFLLPQLSDKKISGSAVESQPNNLLATMAPHRHVKSPCSFALPHNTFIVAFSKTFLFQSYGRYYELEINLETVKQTSGNRTFDQDFLYWYPGRPTLPLTATKYRTARPTVMHISSTMMCRCDAMLLNITHPSSWSLQACGCPTVSVAAAERWSQVS